MIPTRKCREPSTAIPLPIAASTPNISVRQIPAEADGKEAKVDRDIRRRRPKSIARAKRNSIGETLFLGKREKSKG